MSMEELKQQMRLYFQEKKTQMQRTARELQEMELETEAAYEMEKRRVYDVFETMMDACALKISMNPKYADKDKTVAFQQEYLLAFITKPKEWRINYALAMEHNDRNEILLGEVRLATVQEIRDQFVQITKED